MFLKFNLITIFLILSLVSHLFSIPIENVQNVADSVLEKQNSFNKSKYLDILD